MLQSTVPARFAYNWNDGTPRVVPIGFHWNGVEIVLGTPTDAPKMKALHDNGGTELAHADQPNVSPDGAYFHQANMGRHSGFFRPVPQRDRTGHGTAAEQQLSSSKKEPSI